MKNHNRIEAEVVAEQLRGLLSEQSAIVLIGSVARNCALQRSDVDVLVVSQSNPAFKLRWPDFEFHAFSVPRFMAQLENGDDFPNWCTRFGVPLSGTKYWESILQESEHAKWPDWKRKITVAARRLLACQLSIHTEDKEAAAECAMLACDHLIRALLLRDGVFPLSRPELVGQIDPLAPELGVCLSTLLQKSPRDVDFRRILSQLFRTLEEVAPQTHRDYQEQLQRILVETRAPFKAKRFRDAVAAK